MPTSTRDRFLIALSKFLGVSPSQPNPVLALAVCPEWLFIETLNEVLEGESLRLDLEKFNRLMLNCGRRMATSHFFDFFFAGVGSIEKFEAAVESYRKKAVWLYGNFRYAYRLLAAASKADFDAELARAERVDPADYEAREPFDDIEAIDLEDLDLLGYISSSKIRDFDLAVSLLDQLGAASDVEAALSSLGAERRQKASNALAEHGFRLADSEKSMGREGLDELRRAARAKLDELVKRQDAAIAIGKRNTHRYLSLPHLDVYVATSMREKKDFASQHKFIRGVFSNASVSPLKLRFFDPTLSYVDDRITQGLIEMLMLLRAQVTIYNAGVDDTFGKDSEVAATLAQGKPVIVYADNEKRAKMFRVDHPLGLQISVNTGVAHGIIVVKTPEECAEMLRKVILRELDFEIVHEGGNYKLRETTTGSVVRVVSDDPFLTHSFWTYYHRQLS
jgi:hypothetical protein